MGLVGSEMCIRDRSVTELPATVRDKFSLQVGQGKKVKLDKNGGAILDLPIKERGTIQLDGPNYGGSWTKSSSDCVGGKLSIQALPDDAKIRFRDLPQDLEGQQKLLVACIRGCSSTKYWQEFSVAFGPGETSKSVTVELRSKEYGTETREYLLSPGDNSLDADLAK